MVIAPPEPLSLEALGRIAAGAPVALAAGVAERLAASHRQMLALSRADRVVYGLNTGCGPLCEWPVPPEDAARFQQNLIRSHAAGIGPTHPRAIVRATMAARLLSLAQGRSAVRPLVADTLAAMLNAGVHPLIHQPHPGVREYHPNYPDSDRSGFGFSIPAVPPGPHTLTVTIVGRDGGKTELKRQITVR